MKSLLERVAMSLVLCLCLAVVAMAAPAAERNKVLKNADVQVFQKLKSGFVMLDGGGSETDFVLIFIDPKSVAGNENKRSAKTLVAVVKMKTGVVSYTQESIEIDGDKFRVMARTTFDRKGKQLKAEKFTDAQAKWQPAAGSSTESIGDFCFLTPTQRDQYLGDIREEAKGAELPEEYEMMKYIAGMGTAASAKPAAKKK